MAGIRDYDFLDIVGRSPQHKGLRRAEGFLAPDGEDRHGELSLGEICLIVPGVNDEPLTGREVDILQLIAIGEANKQVAGKLGIAEETVKAHLKNIFAKLDVADRTHAVTVAAKRGIIQF